MCQSRGKSNEIDNAYNNNINIVYALLLAPLFMCAKYMIDMTGYERIKILFRRINYQSAREKEQNMLITFREGGTFRAEETHNHLPF